MEEVSAPDVCVEEVWGGAEGPVSIVELALDQRSVHYPLVQHHCVLASLLHAAMTFSLRLKPLSLFDSKVKAHNSAFIHVHLNKILKFDVWCLKKSNDEVIMCVTQVQLNMY